MMTTWRNEIREKTTVRISGETLRIGALYFFLMAGGLWHVLNVFQEVMAASAAPLMALLAIWMITAILRDRKIRSGQQAIRFWFWIAVVFLGGLLAEIAGVITGSVFGQYHYGDVLRPQIAGVPLAIGFAWLGMTLSSMAVAQCLLPTLRPLWLAALLSAAGMVLFDFFMEPAAVKLGYWQWENSAIPLQNYLAWFFLGGVFAALGVGLRLFEGRLPRVAFHAYWAQLIYFIIIHFK